MDEERKDECREKEDDYEFLKETIKAKPIDKKKLISKNKNTGLCGAYDMDEERKDECREKEDDYEFLKETIKAKPIDKKKLISKIGKLAGAGAVFGLAAALVFSMIAPGLLKRRYEKEQASRVKFSQEKIWMKKEKMNAGKKRMIMNS